MPTYHVRRATLADIDALVHHRLAMFADMDLPVDAERITLAFRRWLADMMPAGTYLAWLVEARTDGQPGEMVAATSDSGALAGRIVAGGGITIVPWPPGPQSYDGRIAFVYNVYTDPEHRHRGVARKLMEAIHTWCRDHGIGAVGLNASAGGLPLYESMGYRAMSAPMMVLSFDTQPTLASWLGFR
jgi:GNAT superfamily N-acetyltransferase